MYWELPKSMAPKVYQAVEKYVDCNRDTLLKDDKSVHSNNIKSFHLTANDWKHVFDNDIIMCLIDWIDIDQDMNHIKLQMFDNVSTDIGEKLYQALKDSNVPGSGRMNIKAELDKSCFIKHWRQLNPLQHPKHLLEYRMFQFINNNTSSDYMKRFEKQFLANIQSDVGLVIMTRMVIMQWVVTLRKHRVSIVIYQSI